MGPRLPAMGWPPTKLGPSQTHQPRADTSPAHGEGRNLPGKALAPRARTTLAGDAAAGRLFRGLLLPQDLSLESETAIKAMYLYPYLYYYYISLFISLSISLPMNSGMS